MLCWLRKIELAHVEAGAGATTDATLRYPSFVGGLKNAASRVEELTQSSAQLCIRIMLRKCRKTKQQLCYAATQLLSLATS